MDVTSAEWEGLKALQRPLQDCIVECYLEPAEPDDPASGQLGHPPRWRFHRLRDDKEHANHISTVRSVMESIEDHVTQQDLLDAAAGIRDAWKRRQAEEERAKRKRSEVR